MAKTEAVEKLRDAVRLRHFSHATEKSCVLWLQSYMRALQKFPADWRPEKKAE